MAEKQHHGYNNWDYILRSVHTSPSKGIFYFTNDLENSASCIEIAEF